jgi:hypothetical protein
MDQRICANHVSEPHLKAIIDASNTTEAECDYCDRVAPTVSAWELAQQFDTMFERYFVSTSGGRDEHWNELDEDESEGESVLDVLERVAGLTGEEAEDVAEQLGEMWFDRDTMESRHGDDPHFVQIDKFDEPLSRAWSEMERSLKYEARFNNPTVHRMLETVFGPILDDRIRGSEGVVIEIKPGDSLSTFYRARPFPSLDELQSALQTPERSLGPPPPGIGRAGRMNAKGVPVFYGALDPSVAIAEVRPPVGSHVVLAQFTVARPLRLLDIQNVILIDGVGSLFDPATYDRFTRRDFLKTLVRRIVRPIMPEHEDEDYLITQAVADFLSTHEQLNLDGILFASAQLDPRTRLQKDGRNIVLFNKSSEIESQNDEGGPFAEWETHFNLWDYDDDQVKLDPVLTTASVKPEVNLPRGMRKEKRLFGPALNLDRDTIQIHRVQGVSFKTTTINIAHQRLAKRD